MILRNLGAWALEGLEKVSFMTKCLCLLHVTNSYIITTSSALGPSMVPTIDVTGNFFIAERASVQFRKVVPGDLVIARSPENPNKHIIKRVMGMEGDTVTYFVRPGESEECQTVVVPKGKLWLQGDNIYDSRDSRQFGPVSYGLLESKLLWRLFPLNRFGSMRDK